MAEAVRNLDRVSDGELATLCAQRPIDQQAWEEFYARFHDYVEGLIRRRLGRLATDLPDIVQDAFIKIFRVLPGYDPALSQVKTFLSRVIANLVIDYVRHSRLQPGWNPDSLLESGSLQIQSAQNPEMLRAAAEKIVKQLPDRDRVELMLDLLHGKDVKEICAERGLTESHVYGARNWLRRQLHEISLGFPKY
jgi:RNA polymerase sigma-70 factor (ECF subfamily)